MKTINLSNVTNSLSDNEMKLVKGGNPVGFEVDAPLLADDGGGGGGTNNNCTVFLSESDTDIVSFTKY